MTDTDPASIPAVGDGWMATPAPLDRGDHAAIRRLTGEATQRGAA